MRNTNKIQFLILFIVLLSASLAAQPADNPQTFCNPLNLNYRFMIDGVDARETADPVVILFKDDYYLFGSRAGGYWTSTDLRNWTYIVPTVLDIEGYAPTAVVMRDTLFYTHGWGASAPHVYKSADPKSGVWIQGPSIPTYGDPNLYYDDDGKLYMFDGLSNTKTAANGHVVELDPFTFEEIGDQVDLFYSNAAAHGWERRGDDNLLDEEPWLEGLWVLKKDNKYYLHYAGPGTEFKTYADGIYVADSPMGPYEYAPYSPLSFKPTGFICGAGHGSTFMDKDGHYWHIATMTISINHMFERRVGMWPVAFDPDGQIRCNTDFGDYPQYFPGVKTNPADENFAGMMLLSQKKHAMASSSLEGYGIENAVDEDVRTYWCAPSGDAGEWMMVDLGKECSIQAIQVNFAEHNTIPEQVRGSDKVLYEQYTLEISSDGMTWGMLVDKSQNMQDVPHDYIELENPVTTRYVKLTNVFTPGGGNFAVRDLRIFGNSDQAVFTKINDITIERDAADGRDALIRWSPVPGADGYIIRYGIAPDKLYSNYMVYDADSVAIHSLNHGVDYYFEVEAFDSGTEPYQPIGEFKSSQSGDWNDVNTWARYNGSEWVHPAPNTPSLLEGSIKIIDGHTVTVTAADSADQLIIASGARLVLNKGVSFKIKDGIGVDMMVQGTIENYGMITTDPAATLTFVGDGLYAHRQNGGTLPTATWKYNSTCLIDSVRQNVPWNGNQNFYNIQWNSPNQIGPRSLYWNGNTIGGNITIENTGMGRWQMCEASEGGSALVNIKGDIIQTGGQFTSTGTINGNTTITINVDGSINVTGGNFSVSRGSQGGTGSTLWNIKGNVSLVDATTQSSNTTDDAVFAFAGDRDPQTLTLTNVTYGSGGFPVEVVPGAVLDIGSTVLAGEGSFTLGAGATILTGHADGLDGSLAMTGSFTYDLGSNYGFNGDSPQITGSKMSETVNDLIIDNDTHVTLSKSVTVNGIMKIADGGLELNSNTLTYGPEASLEYSGTGAQVSTDAEFPAAGGPKNLIISNQRRVTLHDSRTIAGNLDLYGDLKLGNNTLTVASTSNANANAYVDTQGGGTLQIPSIGSSPVLFPIGTTGYAPVWVTNSGAVDDISVGAIRDRDDPDYGGRVNVLWNIGESTAGGGDYTLQFGWIRSLENSDFRADRENNAKIYNMTDITEAGTGEYTRQLSELPYTVSRGGITELGPFAVGGFVDPAGVDESSNKVAKEFGLYQNYPNPFNPTTTIDYIIGRTSRVKIVVYDVLGQQIETLVDDKLEAGNYTVQWNTKNNASGIYIYKLITEGFVQTKKMILLK